MNATPIVTSFAPLKDYAEVVCKTDRMGANDLRPILMGLYGEVGSVMTPAKKLHREKEAYKEAKSAALEEFGDALWYLAALCRRTSVDLTEIFAAALEGAGHSSTVATTDSPDAPIGHLSSANEQKALEDTLLDLGSKAASLIPLSINGEKAHELMVDFSCAYLRAVRAAGLSFSQILRQNIEKTVGRFTTPELDALPRFDDAYKAEERIPEKFQILITQRASGQSYLQMNGVFIGDPLTDNILDQDDYRFHDVFHLAHAAVLGWSPVFRSLIKHKRKSNKVIDEAQDGGRAIVVEEGLTAWLFSRAKERDFFKDQSTVSFDILKTIAEFTRGYEVAELPLSLWERAILHGYAVFREVRSNKGGIVLGDRNLRTLDFRPD